MLSQFVGFFGNKIILLGSHNLAENDPPKCFGELGKHCRFVCAALPPSVSIPSSVLR